MPNLKLYLNHDASMDVMKSLGVHMEGYVTGVIDGLCGQTIDPKVRFNYSFEDPFDVVMMVSSSADETVLQIASSLIFRSMARHLHKIELSR